MAQKETPALAGGGTEESDKPNNSQSKDKSNNECAQPFRKPFMESALMWPDVVDGVELLNALEALFERHLSLPKGAAVALALWVVFTHCLDAFEVSPRLAVLSPLPECGKTTLLKLLTRLVPVPLPTSNVTPAVLFRVIEAHRPTLLIDEADTFFDPNSEMSGILNSGHTRDTAYVWRCATANEEFDPRSYSTWCAMAIAKIGSLPPTLDSRSITIPMRRARANEQPLRLQRKHRDGIEILARKCVSWAGTNRYRLEFAEPQFPDGMNNRAADNWRPLLTIADHVGGDWTRRAREAAIALSGNAEVPLGVELLVDIRGVFDTLERDRVSSKEMCQELAKLADRPWCEFRQGYSLSQNQLARLLKPFAIRPRVVRIDERTPRGYALVDFEDAFERYLSPLAGGATP